MQELYNSLAGDRPRLYLTSPLEFSLVFLNIPQETQYHNDYC
jgi:hypothetical protein